MKTKKSVLLMAVLPIGATSLITFIACLMRIFYFDLPDILAESWSIFYSASFFVMDYLFFFAMGMFCVVLMYGKTKNIVISALLCGLTYPVNPLIQFVIRHFMLGNVLYNEEMQEFFNTDVSSVIVNLLHILLVALIAIVIKIIFLRDNCEMKISLLPRVPASCIYLVYFAVLSITQLIGFFSDGAYIQELSGTLLKIVIYLAGYFVAFAGAKVAEHDMKKEAA